ncbi:MAG: CreA family protein [Pseudomonadota bacterium]
MRRAAVRLALLAGPALTAAPGAAEQVGEVSTAFKLLGADHKIVVEAFDDPQVPGVACFVSRAKTGGISGSLGLAEDTADASIACRQVGPISFPEPLEAGEEVFRRSTSLLFKKVQVVRFWDAARRTLIYLTYSDELIDGSPKNAISAVVAGPWGTEPAPEPPVYED